MLVPAAKLIFSITVVSFAVTSLWRGIWYLNNEFTTRIEAEDPTDVLYIERVSAFISVSISLVFFLVLHSLRIPLSSLRKYENASLKGRFLVMTVETIFTLLGVLGTVLWWRGVWHLWDYYIFINDPIKSAWLSWGVGIFGGLLTLTLRSHMAPPGIVALDDEIINLELSIFETPPMLIYLLDETNPHEIDLETPYEKASPKLYLRSELLINFVYKMFFTLFISIFVVFHWRGIWYLADQYLQIDLKPAETLEFTAWLSIVVGTAIILLLWPADSLLKEKWMKFREEKTPAIVAFQCIFERVFTIFATIGIVLIWRGYWYVWDEYLTMESRPLESYFICLAVGYLILLVFFCVRCSLAPPFAVLMDDANPKHMEPWNIPPFINFVMKRL